MNIENFHHEDTGDLSQERLDDSLFRFADVLSGQTWDERRTHGVSIARTVTELIGEDVPIEDMTTKRTKISFKADKTGGIAGDVDFGTPRYVVSSTIDEGIYFDELPANIYSEMLDEAYEKGHPLRKILKGFGATSDPVDVKSTLDELLLSRREKSKFIIADGGEIVRHTISHRYAYVDVVFLSAEYSSDAGSMDWRRLQRPEGLAVELRPVVLDYISEDERTRENEIRRHAEGLDTKLERYFFDKSLAEMLRAQGRPDEAVVRQILGMLAVVSADMSHYRP